jgi:diguanylate cyclase (GGDEF)-like protein
VPSPHVWTLPLLADAAAFAALGLAAWRVRSAARYGDVLARARELRERRLRDAFRGLLGASRRSSGAVLAALEAALREVDDRIDSVLVFVPAGDEIACVHASGTRVCHLEHLRLRRDDSDHRLPVKAAQAGCRASMPESGAALLPTDRFAVAVPLMDGRTLRAVTYVSSARELRPRPDDGIVDVVELAAAPYAIALEREADRADATYDGLTGLLAPRAFRRYLHDEVARAAAASAPGRVLNLWFVDTDCFKAVNDRFGHRAGDAVLQAMASLLQAYVTPDLDVAARNGGDEFCALLRGVSKTRAIARAQAFCEAVRRHDFGLAAQVTASVGIAAFPHDASSSNELLEAADAAMYHSKHNGRDRVSFVVESGRFACVASEAGEELSRKSSRWWHSDIGESFSERSSQ